MDAGVSPAKSILEKPLKHLTEEDISQLTREDCRKFLKDKGMRRPSWNKSQAIQQVLSLKALFEPGDDSGAGVIRKILVSQPENSRRMTSSSAEPTKDSGGGGRISLPEDDNFPHTGKDSPRSAEFSGDSGQSSGETNSRIGQMTIFYCGKINVYDGVPLEKARSIMHFAASSIGMPGNDPTLCSYPTATDNCRLFTPNVMISNRMNTTDKMVELPRERASRDSTEGQVNRKVSLQRYLEKRKDRRFSKGKKAQGVASSSSLEMYLNHQTRLNLAYGQSNLASMIDSPENQTKNSNLSVDLNSEDV